VDVHQLVAHRPLPCLGRYARFPEPQEVCDNSGKCWRGGGASKWWLLRRLLRLPAAASGAQLMQDQQVLGRL